MALGAVFQPAYVHSTGRLTEKEMKDVYTTSVKTETLDECPMAYKNMDDIVNNIEPTADIGR